MLTTAILTVVTILFPVLGLAAPQNEDAYNL